MSSDIMIRDRADSGVATPGPMSTEQHLPDRNADTPLRRDRSARGVADDGPSAVGTAEMRPGHDTAPDGATVMPATPAGWYADPADARGVRWWTGSGWTDHTGPVAPPAVTLDTDPAIGRTAALSETAPAVPMGTAPAVPVGKAQPASASEVPPDRGDRVEPERTGTRERSRGIPSVFTPLGPTRVHTPAVWILAVTPLVLAVGEHANARSLLGHDPMTVRIAGAVTLIALSLLLAFVDRSRLREGWHSDTASPWWVLLTPFAYLVTRTVRVRQETGVRATGMTLSWLLSLLPAVAIAFGWDAIGPLVKLLNAI